MQKKGKYFAGFAVAIGGFEKFVVENHKLAYRRVETQLFNRIGYLDDALVHHFGEFCGNRRVFVFNGVFFADDRTECAGKETVHAFDSLGIPRLDRIEGTHEHFVQAKRIRTVFLNDIVRVHHVLQGLAHFGDNLMQLFSRFFIKEFSAFFFDLIDGNFGACVVFVSVGENHSLVEEFLERFVRGNESQVKEHFMPETAVKKVQHGVFRAPDVQVHGHPVFFQFFADKSVFVLGIDVTQIIPAASRPLRHGVCFARTLASVFIDDIYPVRRIGEWGLSAIAGFEILHVRQANRKFRFVESCDFAVFPMDDGEGFSPVTLAAKEPVPDFIVHRCFANLMGFQPANHFGDAFFFGKPVQ